jgi:LysM repeat protein
MKNITLILSLLVAFFSFAENEKKYSQEEYVSMWKEIAIQQMNEYKIPASITLAQGILESGNGNSLLAREANNHFGTKCSDWKGETFYKEEGSSSQCYRKYKDAKKSYQDHSLFLTTRTRYSDLFKLKMTDYKAWAKGLKEAGYATSSTYPQRLIDIIEKLKLHEFDLNEMQENTDKSEIVKKEVENKVVKTLMSNEHQVQIHANKIKYIVAKKGDTYYRISKEFGLGMWQLYKYNEFGERKDYLVAGDIVYLEPKKRKNKVQKQLVVKEEMTLRMVAQNEGVKVQQLMKYNQLEQEDAILSKGTVVKLK